MTDETGGPLVPGDVPPHRAEAEPPASAADLAGFDADAAEQRAEAALATGGEEQLPPHHDLLGFYDRLRTRVLETVERRAGPLPGGGIIALLLAPGIFILLVRLGFGQGGPPPPGPPGGRAQPH